MMSQKKWLESSRPMRMLKFLRRRASHRKRRLFAVACCRMIWPLLRNEAVRNAVEACEAAADGLISEKERRRLVTLAQSDLSAEQFPGELFAFYYARQAARAATSRVEPTAELVCYAIAHQKAERARYADETIWPVGLESFEHVFGEQVMSDLLREIVNPFFFLDSFDPAWRTPTVVALAETIYNDRTYDVLPILADALMDAGCANPALLAHCQSSGPHARGCWALDLILGKD